MKNKFIHHFIRMCFFWGLSFFNVITPKKRTLIFFQDAATVRDNQYILLNYLIKENYTDVYKIVVFSENSDASWISPDIKAKIFIVSSKLKGLFYRITAKYVFFSFGSNFMSCYSPKDQVTVDLWHGFGLKKIEYEASKTGKLSIPVENTFSKVIIPSNFFRDMIIRSLHCKESQILVSGTPKIDALKLDSKAVDLYDNGKYKKIIFFLPTYRNSKRLGYTGYSNDFPLLNENNIEEVNDVLKDNEICLIIKLHHTAQRDTSISFLKKKYCNIKIYSNDDFNKYDIHFYSALGKADALITDYSSVYQDFLMLNKPIAFIVDDIEEYEKLRGFNFPDPLSLMPGAKIYTIDDLKKFIIDIAYQNDIYEKNREQINTLLNKYHCFENTKNLLTNIGLENMQN